MDGGEGVWSVRETEIASFPPSTFPFSPSAVALLIRRPLQLHRSTWLPFLLATSELTDFSGSFCHEGGFLGGLLPLCSVYPPLSTLALLYSFRRNQTLAKPRGEGRARCALLCVSPSLLLNYADEARIRSASLWM